MAGVSTRISVIDAMTPVMENMYKGVSQLISGLHKLNEASGNAIDTSPFLEAQKSMAEAVAMQKRLAEGYDDVSDEIKGVKTYTEQADSAQRRYNSSLNQGVQRAAELGDSLTNSIKRYIAMAASAYSGKELINASDSWINNSARLGLITDNMQEQSRLQMLIYNSAKDTRGAYSDMVDVTAKLGLLAGDAFGNNAEIVKFTDLMQKSFKLSGAGTQERQSAMYQLTQAMASGKLQGDEFRSIMENAPMLANAIAEYTGVSKGELKELSSEGVITSDIIKNALFMAADDIESKFSTMPMTFGDAWNNIISDITMAFAPVYEMMNGALNSELGQGIITALPGIFEQVSTKAMGLMNVIGSIAITSGPGLRNIAGAVGNITTAIFSANGVAGTLLRTLGQMFSSPAMLKSVQMLGGSIVTVATALNGVLQFAMPLLPIVTDVFIAFKMYNTLNPIISTVATGLANVLNMITSLSTALSGAATAQEALNTAMNANPYLGVASKIAKIVSSLVGLIGAIKAANNAADLAEDSSEYDFENVKEINRIMEQSGVSMSAASQIMDVRNDYESSLKSNEDARQAEYDKWFDDNYEMFKTVAFSGFGPNLSGEDLEKYMIENASKTLYPGLYEITQEYDENKNNLYEKRMESLRAIIEADKMRNSANAELNSISDNPEDYIKGVEDIFVENGYDDTIDVGNVENVNHINDTVDIASEDIKYLRDLADQETINQFTSKLLQPQINVTFGEVRETADVDEIINRITAGLAEDLNNSSDLVHIY